LLAVWLTSGVLPAAPAPGPLEWALIVLALISFGLVAVVQAMFPLWAYHPAAAGLRVHLSNGFYANAVFDRLLRGCLAGRADCSPCRGHDLAGGVGARRTKGPGRNARGSWNGGLE